MPPVGFEPAIPASELPQAYYLRPRDNRDWLSDCIQRENMLRLLLPAVLM